MLLFRHDVRIVVAPFYLPHTLRGLNRTSFFPSEPTSLFSPDPQLDFFTKYMDAHQQAAEEELEMPVRFSFPVVSSELLLDFGSRECVFFHNPAYGNMLSIL